ncbi:MAG: ribosome maturation factor RimM [Tissierellia bacterium]|nr:ribosome maturation factor RimM [Tissierellia bacterium]
MDFIKVGHVMNTHGIKGELKIKPLTDSVERFGEDILFYLGRKKDPVHITSFRDYKGLVYLRFKEFDHINQVLSYKNEYLYVEEKDRYPLEEGKYYIDDLLGCDIFDGEGKKIGVLKDVLTHSVHPIYEVNDGKGQIFYIPGVKEFVKKIDLENQRIIVQLIEGIRDED